jgi:hypothetical protein
MCSLWKVCSGSDERGRENIKWGLSLFLFAFLPTFVRARQKFAIFGPANQCKTRAVDFCSDTSHNEWRSFNA